MSCFSPTCSENAASDGVQWHADDNAEDYGLYGAAVRVWGTPSPMARTDGVFLQPKTRLRVRRLRGIAEASGAKTTLTT